MTSSSIPSDLIPEILSRLPAKSIARFQCVSKLWESMLRSPYFTELLSSAKPHLIFAIENAGVWSIFSLPQHHRSPYEKSSSSSLAVTAEFHMKFPPDNMLIYPRHDRQFSCGYSSGLMYFYGLWVKPEEHRFGVPVIFNPKTARFLTLPWLDRYRETYSFFGFDPIDKQYKVLFMSYPYCCHTHKILTLGTGEMSYRRIKCSLQHEAVSEGICINGVLYYLAEFYTPLGEIDTHGRRHWVTTPLIVCFDVRYEKFKFIYPESYCELINYKGKLGVVYYDDYGDDTVELSLRVLEDVETPEWLEYAYTLRDDKFLDHYVSVVGVTATGEIILSTGDFTSKQPFYIFYFNPEKNTTRRVEIQGFGEYHEAFGIPSSVHVFVDDCSRIYDFADHVEELNVNDDLLKSEIYDVLEYVDTLESSDEEES